MNEPTENKRLPKVRIAHTEEEARALEQENDRNREQRKYWRIFEIEYPNVVMLPSHIDHASECPRCHSKNFHETTRCPTCGTKNMLCEDCQAWWFEVLK